MLLGVWNTDDGNGLRLIKSHEGYRLEGRKILASGAGYVERPVVTATDETGHRLMVTPSLRCGERADLSSWTAQGMKASATGALDFSGVAGGPDDILGRGGDTNGNPIFQAAHGALLPYTRVAWRGCSTSCARICETPAADKIRIKRLVWVKPQLLSKPQNYGLTKRPLSQRNRAREALMQLWPM
jgi:hypothetical protein